MTDKEKVIVKSSFPLFSLIGVIFILLKLDVFAPVGFTTLVVNWSWWWVLVPFWGPWAIVLGIAVVTIVVLLIIGILFAIFDR